VTDPYDAFDRRVRRAIYRRFIGTGHAPSHEDLAADTGEGVPEVEAALERLAARRMIALVPGSRSIWMAHPFSAVPTAYPVETAEARYLANCAWDALGIPALLGTDSRTRTTCADCGETLEIRVEDGRAYSDGERVHFGVGPRRFWEDVGFT
jgi:DNA-binding transcriptional MocR family regulator